MCESMNSRPLSIRTFWLWITILLLGLAGLLLLPGGFAEKSKALLHGLCAQTPSHTFSLGGQPLPFDARMTGIYLGAAFTLIYLGLRRQLLAQDHPSIPTLMLLAAMVGAMGLDGFNSLLTDIGRWHPWTTTNTTRLLTGYGAGMALAVSLIWLLAGTVFQISNRRPVMTSIWDVVWSGVPLLPIAIGLYAAPGWLYYPLASILIVSAWVVLGTLGLVGLLLVSRWDERIVHPAELHIPGSIGLIIGLIIMVLLSLGRQWLETTLGITVAVQ